MKDHWQIMLIPSIALLNFELVENRSAKCAKDTWGLGSCKLMLSIMYF